MINAYQKIIRTHMHPLIWHIYLSWVNHVVKLITQKRLGHPFKLQDVHKSAYMSAHLAKNKIYTQLENDRYISSKVIEKGNNNVMTPIAVDTKMNHMVSTAMGEDVALMEGSHVKQKDREIRKTPQDDACFHEVQVQDSIDVHKVTLKTRKRGRSKSTKVVKYVNPRGKDAMYNIR